MRRPQSPVPHRWRPAAGDVAFVALSVTAALGLLAANWPAAPPPGPRTDLRREAVTLPVWTGAPAAPAVTVAEALPKPVPKPAKKPQPKLAAKKASGQPAGSRSRVTAVSEQLVAAPPLSADPPQQMLDPFSGDPECPVCAGKSKCSDQGPRVLQWTVPREPGVDWPPEDQCTGESLSALCSVLSRIAPDREVLMAVANSKAPGLDKFIDNVRRRVGIQNFIITALDQPLAERLERDGVPYWYRPNKAQGNHKVSAEKFAIVRDFIDVGCSVLLTDTDVVYFKSPFPYLGHDHDVETMVDGWDWETAFGFTDVVDDPTLGEYGRRRMRTNRIQAFNSGLWYIAATHAGRRLMDIMALRMREEETWDQAAYFMELLFPSRDAHLASGCSVRVLSPLCFMNSKVMVRRIRPRLQAVKGGRAAKLAAAKRYGPIALHANYHQDKPHKMEQAERLWLQDEADALDECSCRGAPGHCGCEPGTVSVAELEKEWKHGVNDGYASGREWVNGPAALGRGPAERKNRHDPLELSLSGTAQPPSGRHHCAPLKAWGGLLPRSAARELRRIKKPGSCGGGGLSGGRAELCNFLSGAEEVMLIVAGAGGADELSALRLLLSDGVQRLELQTSTLVAALSADVADAATEAGVTTVAMESWRGATDAVALKWRIAADVLLSGISVLLVDAATVLLSSPWPSLYRDADVEVATSGWDDRSAYGYDHVVDDPKMGWSRYCHGVRVGGRDAGFAFLQATVEAATTATRVAGRCSGKAGCSDSDALSAELFEPSHGDHTSSGAVARTMNYLCFANSKTVWRHWVRDAEGPLRGLSPVAVRLQYHPPAEAADRMRTVLRAFQSVPDVSVLREWGLSGGLRKDPAATKALQSTCATAASKLAAADGSGMKGLWSWAGIKPLRFLDRGELEQPWGSGRWAPLPLDAVGRPRAVANFAGSNHILLFEAPDMFVSERCSDGDIVVGRLTDGSAPG